MAEVAMRRDGPVLWVTLDRPEALNALNAQMAAGLAAALEEAGDPAVRAVVLTGAGRGFCAGQDVAELQGPTGRIPTLVREQLNPVVLAIRGLEKPVLAAVNGPAAGAGLALALACDVRLAADSAVLVPGFAGLGLAPDTGASWLAARLLGPARAFEWLATGRRLTAAEALAWGLVSEVVADDALAARAAEVAAQYAALPTRAVWETKRLLDGAATASFEQQVEREALAQGELALTDDVAEGLAAFGARRPAVFTGAPPESHPVRLVVTDDLRRWRLTVLLRWVLVLPHAALLLAWATLVAVLWPVLWVVALVRGRLPDALHAWAGRYVRYAAHVGAYAYLAADPFPGFAGRPGTYPVDVRIAEPAPQARWSSALRPLLALPAVVFANVLWVVLAVVGLVGWFAALLLGRMPRGMRDLMAYCLRYQAQSSAYLVLLTGRYPALAGDSGTQYEEE